MPHVYIPTDNAEQWASFLAEPVKHWRSGYSAKSLAYSWQEASGFPSEVESVLKACPPFADIEPLLALPEHQVPLPGGARPSQNDVWVLARSGGALVSIAVEGKVSESFDKTIAEWMGEGTKGKTTRLAYLLETLSLPKDISPETRYQLLHRTVSAIIEAKRFCATKAMMLVHSFSQTSEWFDDYRAFVQLFGVDAELNRLHSVGVRGGVDLYLGWVKGNPKYLTR